MRSALLHCVRSFSRRSYERSEVEFRYNNSKDAKQAKRSRSDVSIKELYHIVLKLIRGLISNNASRS